MNGGQCVNDIRAAVAGLNRGDLNAYFRHFGPTSLRWVDGIPEPFSLSDVGENLEQLLSAFEGLHLGEELIFGTDRHVCAHWRMTGQHVGDYLSISPAGLAIDVRICEVYEFDAGRVSTTWTHGDPIAMLRQIDGTAASGGPQ